MARQLLLARFNRSKWGKSGDRYTYRCFVCYMMMVVLYVKIAGWQSTKMIFYYHTAAPTLALVSRTVDFVQLE